MDRGDNQYSYILSLSDIRKYTEYTVLKPMFCQISSNKSVLNDLLAAAVCSVTGSLRY